MRTHNFILGPVDTDSISICKPDMSPFTEEEQEALIAEINALMPEKIKYAHDGYYNRCIAFKAKNYVLYDGVKIKVKGSGLKGSTKSVALREMTNKFIETMCYTTDKDTMNQKLFEIYNSYATEILNITDIKRWSARKTISSTMMESTRPNETKVMDAIKDSDYKEGDRCFVFYKQDDSLCLYENFDGDYNKTRLLKNIHDTVMIFSTVLDIKQFPNYSLKKNQKLLETLDKTTNV